MNFSPYGFPMQPKSPQEMQNEMSALMSQYQASYNGTRQAAGQTTTQTAAVGEKGEFVKVSGYDEVPDYPTRLDGTATLFFDFKNRVFWSKKFSNGGHSIQAFRFEPINHAETQKQDDDDTKLLEDVPDPMAERLDKLESMMRELLSKGTKPKKEIVKDEI